MAAKPVPLSRAGTHVRVSFEFFPPRNAEMEANFWDAATRLEPLNPAFVSVTYGAGGSTRERTHAIGRAHRARDDDEAGGSSDLRRRVEGRNSRHLARLSRRGRPPHRGAARRSADRVRRPIRNRARRLSVDRRAGRRRPAYRRFRGLGRRPIPRSTRKARPSCTTSKSSSRRSTPGRPGRSPSSSSTIPSISAFSTSPPPRGSTIPIVPGIFPVQNFKQTANFARRAGASVPQWLADRFEGLEDDPVTRRLVAAAVCAEQVIDLIDHGVEELHFYTMNRADLVFAICHLVGLRAKPVGSEPQEQEPSPLRRRAW